MVPSRTQIDERIRSFAVTCERLGLKITHQRAEIFRIVVSTEGHPDVLSVYRRVKKRKNPGQTTHFFASAACRSSQGGRTVRAGVPVGPGSWRSRWGGLCACSGAWVRGSNRPRHRVPPIGPIREHTRPREARHTP